MERAIFDTSVWLNMLTNVSTRQSEMLLDYVVENSDLIYLTPTIVQEILQGVKSQKDFSEKKRVLESFNIFNMDWLEISKKAAKLYFDLRKKGITIRKSNDCLIAQVAIENKVLLVHNDRDFELIASASSLRTY